MEFRLEEVSNRSQFVLEEPLDAFSPPSERFGFGNIEAISPFMKSLPVCQLESKFLLDDCCIENQENLGEVNENTNSDTSSEPTHNLSEAAASLVTPQNKILDMPIFSPVSVLVGNQETSPNFTPDPNLDDGIHSIVTPIKLNRVNLTPLKQPVSIPSLHLQRSPLSRNSVPEVNQSTGRSNEGETLCGAIQNNNYFYGGYDLTRRSDEARQEEEEALKRYFDGNDNDSPSTPRTPTTMLPSSLECPESPHLSTRSKEMSRQSSLNDTKILLTTQLKRSHSVFMFNRHFEYLRELGRGSFSTVYEARDRRKGTLCAVKMSKREFNGKEDREKYMHEIESVANLPEHPNIVKYYRGWQQDLHFFLQMELCEGGSLRHYLDNLSHPLSETKVRKYMKQIASALHHLHSRGVLHLDIKPANIFLDAQGDLKLGDFGHAVLRQQWQWEEGDGGYVAPELLKWGTPSPAADVYSFGATCYEWMTSSLLPRALPDRQAAISEAFRLGRISPELVSLVQRMLSENPLQRPSAEFVLAHSG